LTELVFHREVTVAASRPSQQREPRRRWSLSEKRRIVELTLRAGASLRSIAHDQGIHPNNLYNWKALYQTGKLGVQPKPAASVATSAPSATFLPVRVAPAARAARRPPIADVGARAGSILQLVLASGATMRIETDLLEAEFVCAVIAALRR
jgi:transposase-like protein